MDCEAIDTLGLAFSAYLDDLRYLHIFNFVLKHFTLDTFMSSILPELDHYLLLSHTSHHDTWHHTPLSIRMRCRSVFDHFGCAFIHLLDFRFNIFHDGRAWQIVDLVVKMIFILTIGMLSVELLALCILSIDHHCFIHRSILFFFVNMVSQYMVLFSITYLRLDIFIAWWMSIFHSTVVLRHFVSQFVHCYILGHPPFS